MFLHKGLFTFSSTTTYMKYLLLTLLAIALSNCQIGVQQSHAEMTNIACTGGQCVTYQKVNIEGMEYGVFSATHHYGMAPFAVNLTKEKLEIELLHKQLASK